jgi:hypothetical protein
MRNLLAASVVILSVTTWARWAGPMVLSSQEPGAQLRQEFLRAYNAKDVEAVAAL